MLLTMCGAASSASRAQVLSNGTTLRVYLSAPYVSGDETGLTLSTLTITGVAGTGSNYVDYTLSAAVYPGQSLGTITVGTTSTLYTTAGKVQPGTLAIGQPSGAMLHLGGEGVATSYVAAIVGGKSIRRDFLPFPTPTKTATGVFNFLADKVNGLEIRTINDDVAPYRALSTTIGANHGWYMFSIPCAGHGKVTADIGSVYTKSSIQYILVDIIDANSLRIARRTSASTTAPTSGTFTYVSGGVSSSGITSSASGTGAQWYPPWTNRQMSVTVDGSTVSATTGTYLYSDNVTFTESYAILERATIVAWYEASGGGGGVVPSGDPAIRINISYRFDAEANCTIITSFEAMKSGLALKDIMFLQAQRMNTGVDGTIEYYVPKALPFTHEGVEYDYANIDSSNAASWSARADFTPARCEADGILCDRLIQLSDNYGFAMGFLPLESAGIAQRRTECTVKALQIGTGAAKVYMSAVDKGNLTLTDGDYYSAIGYRNVLIRDAARTCCYPVRTGTDDYLYVDWHVDGTDAIPVPADYVGRDFEVVEKSANVTLNSASLGSTISVTVSDAATYGYLILKVLP